ncbi:DUF1642 domain-containing protein [Streptococcus mitis]|uniref:DUF1642 domain-containing protein n=1 Tax=Streptococcus mitis TaxID=28037 RepID=UPI0012923BF2|nr:DUF1642 domain-containing protein [Streptococcus mitis]MQQ32650.1 DUF1642 domain-containing protein [Streptococcus mitis]
MNKQELIKEFEEIGIHGLNMFGTVVKGIPTETAIDLIKQLDEPQPVKVPPSVAVWYEINKDNLDKNIAYLCLNNWGEFINDKTLFKWMSNTDNFIQILVNMHQFGYEVEEEKRYFVKVKATKHYFDKDGNGRVYFSLAYKSHFTKKQLEEADFGWVFDCPGIEIEEVE